MGFSELSVSGVAGNAASTVSDGGSCAVLIVFVGDSKLFWLLPRMETVDSSFLFLVVEGVMTALQRLPRPMTKQPAIRVLK